MKFHQKCCIKYYETLTWVDGQRGGCDDGIADAVFRDALVFRVVLPDPGGLDAQNGHGQLLNDQVARRLRQQLRNKNTKRQSSESFIMGGQSASVCRRVNRLVSRLLSERDELRSPSFAPARPRGPRADEGSEQSTSNLALIAPAHSPSFRQHFVLFVQ